MIVATKKISTIASFIGYGLDVSLIGYGLDNFAR